MGIEFERMKQEVCGRIVTITSWYDDNLRTWRASAPAYPYLTTRISAESDILTSRSAAIHRMITLLTAYFNQKHR
jgi:hypothetical protein